MVGTANPGGVGKAPPSGAAELASVLVWLRNITPEQLSEIARLTQRYEEVTEAAEVAKREANERIAAADARESEALRAALTSKQEADERNRLCTERENRNAADARKNAEDAARNAADRQKIEDGERRLSAARKSLEGIGS